ncbi:hypothetical protein [Gardnerella vaginalis]|uniref:hypothetical protein n=1 Tax=Gardnerella vaginalis TaxID=2702 RepID=UPI003970D4A7
MNLHLQIATTPSNMLSIATITIKDDSEPVSGIVPRNLCDLRFAQAPVLLPLVGVAKTASFLDASVF